MMYDIPVPGDKFTTGVQYADDTALWTCHSTAGLACRQMQKNLIELETWCSKWRLQPNPAKSQVVLIRHPNFSLNPRLDPAQVTLSLWGQNLRLCDSATYLGIIINRTLSDRADLEGVLSSMRRRASLLKMLNGGIKGCKPETLLHTYKTFIRPVLQYRAPLITTARKSLVDRLASFERSVLRVCLGLQRDHPSDEVYRLAGVEPIAVRLTRAQQNYISRAILREHGPVLDTIGLPHGPITSTPKNKVPYWPACTLNIVQAEALPACLADTKTCINSRLLAQ